MDVNVDMDTYLNNICSINGVRGDGIIIHSFIHSLFVEWDDFEGFGFLIIC